MGDTPLIYACKQGTTDFVRVLLSFGADINKESSWNGMTPLQTSSWLNRADMVQLLLENGADVNVLHNMDNAPSFTPAMFKFKEMPYLQNDAMTKLTGCDLKNIVPTDPAAKGKIDLGFNSLHIAAFKGYTKVLETLLDWDADIKKMSKHGQMAIHIAAEVGHLPVVCALMNAGADIADKTEKGVTALFVASHAQNIRVVEALLYGTAKNRTITDISDSNGNSILHHLCGYPYRSPKVLRLMKNLIARGCHIEKVNSQGVPALHGWFREQLSGNTS